MGDITITLNEQQEKFLKQFAQNHFAGAEDNLGTQHPFHAVQTERKRVVDPDYGSVDETKYMVPDWINDGYDSPEELVRAYYEDKQCPIEIVTFDQAYGYDSFIDVSGEEQDILDDEDYLKAYGIDSSFYYKVNIEKYHVDVAYFFILEEANKYIKYQGHNLKNPRTYTYGPGYGNNGDYIHFWELLFKIGKQLNEF